MQDSLTWYWTALLVWNTITFILMGLDKFLARQHLWRIPERTLLLSGLLLGATGGLVGMFVFRHKTKKQKFQILLPLYLILNLVTLFGFSRILA